MIDEILHVLTIFAHPDDETMLTGGTLALLACAGAHIHYLCATRGEGGELGEPPICTRTEIGSYRERELALAIEALGGGTLSFLGYIDPLVGEKDKLYAYTDNFDGLVSQIVQSIQKHKPGAVITHGSNGEYGHPGHILTHNAVLSAVERLAQAAPLLYTFCADFPGHPRPRHANPDDPADIILDVTTAIEQKARAAYCHRSQIALFLRRRSQQAGYRLTVPETLLNVESLHRTYPPVGGAPDDSVARLLKPWVKRHTL
jgi:LmbE family N-acetylglucosaminyl deacetylase